MSTVEKDLKHTHSGARCPMAQSLHDFCPAQPGDSRSVCPALNTMANHGYMYAPCSFYIHLKMLTIPSSPRDGRAVTIPSLIFAVQKCFGVSFLLSALLTTVTMFTTGHFWSANLYELGKHSAIEHDASLVHDDTPKDVKFAPIHVNHGLLKALIDDVRPRPVVRDGLIDPDDMILVDKYDLARVRIRRELQSAPLSAIHAEVARGECALLIGVLGWKKDKREGVPLRRLVEFLGDERFPDGWKPVRTQGLIETIIGSRGMKDAISKMRSGELSMEA